MSLSKSTVFGLKLAAFILMVPIVLILVIFIYLYTADLSRYQDWVEQKVSQTLGREFAISGRFEPKFSLHPELIATEISLANPDWIKQPHMLEVNELYIKVDLLSLLSDTFWLEALDMQGVSLMTAINDTGKANWVFDSADSTTDNTEPKQASGSITVPVMVKHLNIRDLDYLHQDLRDGSEITVNLASVTADIDERDYITAALQGDVMGKSVNLKGEVGTLANLVNSRPITVQLASQIEALEFEVQSDLDFSGKVITLEQFTATSGQSNLSGELTFDLTDKPEITGQLRSAYLDFNSFLGTEQSPETTADTAKPDTTESESEYVISETPLDLSALQKADINIQYDGGFTAIKQHKFSNLDFQIELQAGNLSITKLNAELPQGGKMKGTVQLQTLAQGYGIDIDLLGEQFLLLGSLEEDVAVKQQPRSELIFKLQGQGTSAHNIAASSNGLIQVITGAGRMPNSNLSVLTNDILMSLLNKLNPFMTKEEYTNIECGINIVTIKEGIAKLEPLLMTTDKIAILGKGEINFHNEKLNVDWNTKARSGLGINASALLNPYIRLGGTLAKPAIGLKPVEGAVTAGVAIATGGLSILGQGLWNRMQGEQDYCKKIKQSLDLE